MFKVKSRSCKPDLPPLLTLKICASRLEVPLSNLFNISLGTATIPHCWKIVRIRPILRKGSDKYRHTDCSSALLNVFENLFHGRILTDVQIHDPMLFAYKSPVFKLIVVSYSVASSVDDTSCVVRLAFLDYAAPGSQYPSSNPRKRHPDVMIILRDGFYSRT